MFLHPGAARISKDYEQSLAEKTADRQLFKPNGDEVRPSRDVLLAELALSAPLAGAALAVEFSKRAVGKLKLTETVSVLNAKVASVHRGDLREAEAILTAQALALNAIFTDMDMAVRSRVNMRHSLDVADRLMRLALKAQGQCRATFEALAAIKNPPAAVFARQANIAHGLQQVNNGVPGRAATTRACHHRLEQNELLEHHDGERMDTTGAAGASGAAMATVGALDRPVHC